MNEAARLAIAAVAQFFPAAVHVDQRELLCMARMLYGEGRGNTAQHFLDAQVALNRARRRGDKICKTVRRPAQFAGYWVEPKPGDPAWIKALESAAIVLTVPMRDRTAGAEYFYNVETDNPPWRHGMVETKRYHKHVYLKEEP